MANHDTTWWTPQVEMSQICANHIVFDLVRHSFMTLWHVKRCYGDRHLEHMITPKHNCHKIGLSVWFGSKIALQSGLVLHLFNISSAMAVPAINPPVQAFCWGTTIWNQNDQSRTGIQGINLKVEASSHSIHINHLPEEVNIEPREAREVKATCLTSPAKYSPLHRLLSIVLMFIYKHVDSEFIIQ